MLIKHDQAGVLWTGQEVMFRSQWEEKVSKLLIEFGYQRVYTPDVYKQELHGAFSPDFVKEGDCKFRPSMPLRLEFDNEEDFRRELRKYEHQRDDVYLGHKGLCHAAMMKEMVAGKNRLPLKFYEFAEIYDLENNKPVSNCGLYITVACCPEDLNKYGGEVYAAIMKSETDKLRRGKYSLKVNTTKEILYTAPDGHKKEIGLVMARATYELQDGWQDIRSVPQIIKGMGSPSVAAPTQDWRTTDEVLKLLSGNVPDSGSNVWYYVLAGFLALFATIVLIAVLR